MSIKIRAHGNRSRVLRMLVKRLSDVAFALSREHILACAEAIEKETPIFAGNHNTKIIPLRDRRNTDMSARKRLAGGGVNNCPADLKSGGGLDLLGGQQTTGENSKARKPDAIHCSSVWTNSRVALALPRAVNVTCTDLELYWSRTSGFRNSI